MATKTQRTRTTTEEASQLPAAFPQDKRNKKNKLPTKPDKGKKKEGD